MRYLHPRNWQITVKVSITMLLTSLIPMVFIAYYNLNGSLASVGNTEYRNLELLAAATAERLDQLMLDNLIAADQLGSDSEVIALVANPGSAPTSLYESVSASLIRILATNPKYEYVYLMDKTGKAVISRQLDSVPTVEGQNFANRAYFMEAMKGAPYIDVLVGRTSKRLGFYFSAPIMNDSRQTIGVAIIKLQGEALTDIVNKFKAGNTGYAFLIDQDGVIVSHPIKDWYYRSILPLTREAELKVGQRFVLSGCEDAKNLDPCKVNTLNLPELAPVLGGSATGKNATYRSPIDGTEQIVGVATTKQLNWTVAVNEAKEEFTSPLTQLAQQTALSVILIGIVVAACGIWLALAVTRPIGKLALAAHTVEKGEVFKPEALADVVTLGDEVGNLARVFSAMVLALNARVSELRTVNEVAKKITSSVDISDTLMLVLNSIRNVVPYDQADVLLYDAHREEFDTRAIVDEQGFRLIPLGDPSLKFSRRLGRFNYFFDKREYMGAPLRLPNVEPTPKDGMPYEREWGEFKPKAYLGAPLHSKDKLIGIIELSNARPDTFSSDHERVLELIAVQAAIAVQNALEVENREAELKRQIDELKIFIDESKKEKYVSEIVESDFFQSLSEKAKNIRNQRQTKSRPDL